MAFKLTKAEGKTFDELLETLKKKAAELEAVEDTRITAIASLNDQVADALRDYNTALNAMSDFVQTKAGEFRDAFDDKSERWQEGDAGVAASALTEEWENIDLNEHDIEDQPEIANTDTQSDIDALENLPREADAH